MASSNPFEQHSEQHVRCSTSSDVASTASSTKAPPGPLEQTPESRIFHITRTSSLTNWTVTLDDNSPLFYVRVSNFRPGKPDITLHAGAERNGTVVGASKFRKSSSDSKLCLGDPDEPLNTVWEDFTLERTWDHSKYRFEVTIDGVRRSFLWKRTHSVGVQDSLPRKLSSYNHKLVDERTGKVIGAYANKTFSLKTQGKFQLNKNYGRDFDIMFLLSGLTIVERTRRRNAARSSGGS